MTIHQATPHSIPTTGYIRRFRLAELLGVSVSTIDRKVRNGSLPRPVKLGEKITAFSKLKTGHHYEHEKAPSRAGLRSP